ncbi:hypothetical protein ACFW1A_23480 [Kitasatospora sp. NPDC058965]|uniref:hypothetical protein n=1 Tax=Kitasatospora sp. NPDC058965 TaxID=3346682 RepID=UPI00367B850A
MAISTVLPVTGGGIAAAGAATPSAVHTVDVGGIVAGAVQSPDGSKLYVTADGKLKTVDLATYTVTAQVALANSNSDYRQTVISPDGTRVYAVSGQVMNVVDTTSNTLVAQVPLPAQNQPANWPGGRTHTVLISADGATVYVAQDGYTGYGVPPVPPPGAFAETPGRVLAFATAQNAFVGQVAFNGAYLHTIALRPGTRDLYAASASGLMHLDASTPTPTVVGRVTGLSTAVSTEAFSPDGTKLYVQDSQHGNQVTPVNPATDAAQTPVTLALGIATLSVGPDGTQLRGLHYDSSTGSATVASFDATTGANLPALAVPSTLRATFDATFSPDDSTVYAIGTMPSSYDCAVQIIQR